LQEFHSAMEEAKADIVGLWALRFLISKVSHYTIFLFWQKKRSKTCKTKNWYAL